MRYLRLFAINWVATLAALLAHGPAWAEQQQRIYRGLSAGQADVEEMHLNCVFHWGLPAVTDKAFPGTLSLLEKFRDKGITVFVNAAFPYAAEPRFYAPGKVGSQMGLDYDFLGPYGDIWNERYAEAAARNAPAVINLTSDEITWNNAHIGYTFYGLKGVGDELPYYCDSESCRAEFKKRSGLEFPKLGPSRLLKSNTPVHRQFILFRYRALAESLARFQETARKAHPDFQSSLMLNLAPVMGLERYPSGVALDMLGETFTPDFLMSTVFHLGEDYRGDETHYLAAETAKHLAASNPGSKVIPFTAAKKWGESFNMGRELRRSPPGVVGRIPYNSIYRPAEIAGINLSAVGHGADGVCMFGNAGSLDSRVKRAVQRSFLALEKAEAWLAGSQPPSDILVLYSRAGEDFYGLAHENPDLDAVADGSMALREMGGWVQPCNALTAFLGRTSDQTLGFRAHKAAIHFLFRNALPFRMHYLDNLKEEELEGARLILLPFAHALSHEALKLLQGAVDRGSKLMIFGPLGEIDQNGDSHPAPLLKPLVEKLPHGEGPALTDGKVAHVPDLSSWDPARSPGFADALRAIIQNLLGNELPLELEKPPGSEIEAALRVKSASDQTVILINWDEEVRTARLGLRLPPGAYSVEVWDVVRGEFQGGMGRVHAAEDLRALALEFMPGGSFIVHVSPAHQ